MKKLFGKFFGKEKNALLLIIAAFCILSGCATPLTTAVEKRDTQQIKTLLDSGEDINEAGGDPAYPPLIHAILNKYYDVAKLLIERGADVNNWSPLSYAAQAGDMATVNLLLEKGAEVNFITHGSPLVAAAKYGRTNIAERFLEKGADLDYALDFCKEQSTDWLWGANYYSCISILKSIKAKRETQMQQSAKPQDLTNKDVKAMLWQSSVKSDIDELPPIKSKPNRNAYAIVIGIENYRQKLPKADFAVGDAKLVSEYLSKVMGYPEENVVTLLNDHATHIDLVKYFEKWLPNNVETGGTVFVYYSGHGAPNTKTGDAYLVPYDGDPSFIEQTGYPLKKLYKSLNKLQAKEIIVALDSCFSGAGGRSVIAKGARPLVMNLQSNMILSKNMTVLSASSGDQTSSTYDEKGHGLFTYFMLKGIKNEDVVKPDGSIKMDDLFGYIKPQVERIARKQYNNEQTPQLMGEKKN
ncbi:MAG: caspase family protein [Deltaproteobacteria bacterium]|nr:caspase family protein [Deltaproteobacteria bacterium]